MDVKPYKMTSSKQLNIRIKFAPQKPDPVPEEAAYIYHWQRIIGASLLSITALALFVYGVVSYLQPTQSRAPNRVVKLETAEQSTAKQAAPDNQAAISDPSKTLLAAEAKSLNQSQTDNEAETTASSNSPAAPHFSPVLVHSGSEVFSKQIQPFVITQAVKNRQPVGSINDIQPDVNNIITVYAYSKVLGLKGETLYYKWRLNGRDVAQVKVKIGSDRWRSYSRKFIQSHMQGDWSVALENSKGELLAVNRFQY